VNKECNVSDPCRDRNPHGNSLSVPNGDSDMKWRFGRWSVEKKKGTHMRSTIKKEEAARAR